MTHQDSSQPVDDDEIDLRALFETLRRQIGLIIATTAIVVAGALFYLFTVTPIYTASALILVDPAQKDLLEPGSGAGVNASFSNSKVDSEVEILRSDAIALGVVEREKLITDPEFRPSVGLVEKIKTAIGIQSDEKIDPKAIVRGIVQRFKSMTRIERKRSTYLISVSVSSTSPDRAADLANSLSEVYIEKQVESKIGSTLAARDVLQKQIEVARANLAQSERALDEFIRTNLQRIEAEAGRSDVTLLTQQLDQLQSLRLQKEVTLSRSREDLLNQNWQDLVAGLESQALGELERQRADIRRRLGQVVASSQEALDLQQELAKLEESLAEQSQRELSSLQQELGNLGSQEEETRRKIRETLFAGQLPPDLLAQIFEIQQEASIARAQYQNLLARAQDVEMQAGVQIADSRVVSPALPPTGPSFPNKKMVLALGLVLGGGLGVFFAFLREFFIGGFTSADQLQDAIQAPIGTVVPLAQNLETDERSPADRVVTAPLSPYAESIRRLRASVDHAVKREANPDDPDAKKSITILVTSAVPGEGKTTTALALARTYAQAGNHVLLIDSDLRKPSLHTFIGAGTSSGFLEYLRNPEAHTNLRDFSSADPLSNITMILGRGRSSTPTDQLVSSAEFARVLSGARNSFDVIIMDSPPLLPVVDGRYLADYADVVLLVVRWASTSQGDLRTARTTLRDSMDGGKPLVGVLSQQEGRGRARYGYYYGYGDEIT